MRLIYILGLEHSGTTLLDHLLSGAPGTVGLGEVAGYFSASHMRQYDQRFGHLDDAYLCSCGHLESDCDIWREVSGLSGLHGSADRLAQYKALVEVCTNRAGEDAILIDSSKSIVGLQNWLSVAEDVGLRLDQIRVVHAIKDARSFAASMLKKHNAPARRFSSGSWLRLARHFNYWLGANRAFADHLKAMNVFSELSLYEKVCASPDETVRRIMAEWLPQTAIPMSVGHNQSHILIGNKAFILRNRTGIQYDDAWRKNFAVKLLYRLHAGVQAFNKEVHARAGQTLL
jgi:hypothetical protein